MYSIECYRHTRLDIFDIYFLKKPMIEYDAQLGINTYNLRTDQMSSKQHPFLSKCIPWTSIQVLQFYHFIRLSDFFLVFFLLYINSFLLFARKEDGYERLFTSKFSVETTQGDRECLKSTKRIIEIHGEHIIGNSSKLHHNVVLYKKQKWKKKHFKEKLSLRQKEHAK